jgi:hypothetical protein
VKNEGKMQVLGVLALLGAGLILAGCKSAPPLTQTDALAMIQAKYDQTPAVGTDITLKDLGMSQGVVAEYWVETKRYPNGYWADFTLLPEGKKFVKLASGGDVIQWRPESPTDKTFSVVVTTLVANHLKARDIGPIQDGVGGGKTAQYTEAVNLDGVPGPLQNIAHDPGNQPSTQREADFVLVNGAWKLQSIE